MKPPSSAALLAILAVVEKLFGVLGGPAVNVTFLHVNDHHSHIDEHSLDLDRNNSVPGLSVDTEELRMFYGKLLVALFS